MKRRTVHLMFGTLAIVCGVMATVQFVQLRQIRAINDKTAQINTLPLSEPVSTEKSAAPKVRLAQAWASSQRQKYDAAATLYNRLIRQQSSGPVKHAAMLNLGNLYMKQGLAAQSEGAGAGTYLPMFELAKQRYRDLLKAEPNDWDARYNLERALRLAPEDKQAFADPEYEIVERRRVKLRGMSNVELP